MITLTLSGICENCPYYDIVIKEHDFSTNSSFKILKPVPICKFKLICERIEEFYTGKAHDDEECKEE